MLVRAPLLALTQATRGAIAPSLSVASLSASTAESTTIPTPTRVCSDERLIEFLNSIGKNTIMYKDRFENFEEFLQLPEVTMRRRLIPTAARRYLMSWRSKYSKGWYDPARPVAENIFHPTPTGHLKERTAKPFQTSHGKIYK